MIAGFHFRRGTVIRRVSMIVICMFLAGCDSGPTADDIKSALNNFLDGAFGPYSPLNNHMVVKDVKDVSCSAAEGKPGYVCSYDLVVLNPGKTANEDQGKKTARFVKDNDKWAMMRDK